MFHTIQSNCDFLTPDPPFPLPPYVQTVKFFVQNFVQIIFPSLNENVSHQNKK